MRFRRALDRGNVTEALGRLGAPVRQPCRSARTDSPPCWWGPREVQPRCAALARSLPPGDEEPRPPREPGGARPPRCDPGESSGRDCSGRAPQPATILRTNRRGTCPLVAGGVKTQQAPGPLVVDKSESRTSQLSRLAKAGEFRRKTRRPARLSFTKSFANGPRVTPAKEWRRPARKAEDFAPTSYRPSGGLLCRRLGRDPSGH
jgi:hypothetical protein